jgi:hypothetical protein
MFSVPVVDSNQKPLMPTKAPRAERWVKSGKATPFWKRGVFCVRLNVEPSDRKVQEIGVGIDPGSKREGFTVKSESKTYINVQTNAVTWVSVNEKTSTSLRRNRRYRNTPYRKCRSNRSVPNRIPPSTKARWGWKLRIVNWLCKMFPISHFAVEDIAARTIEGARRWNKSFSPLEVGKSWFYKELEKIGKLFLYAGYTTKELRDKHNLKKTSQKLSDTFEAHCVDSWVIVNNLIGGHLRPDNTSMLKIVPLQFHRRQLHVQNFSKGHVRKPYGGTMSLGLKRGSIVKHSKYNLCYVGGFSKGRVSLHSLESGNRLTQSAKKQDIKALSYNTWRTTFCRKEG